MRESLFHLADDPRTSIQSRIREMLVSAILDGQLAGGEALPSSRRMAKVLGVSRNTVVLAYQELVADGFLVARERSGIYVNDEIDTQRMPSADSDGERIKSAPDWATRFRVRPGQLESFEKPIDWPSYPYPFIYGQVDQTLFPITAWRECNRQALGRKWMDAWTRDAYSRDDDMLVDQIRSRILPRRGIHASPDEILITLGAQNALYLIASQLITPDHRVALEDPGYPDVRHIFMLRTDRLDFIPVDDAGLPVDDRLAPCDYLYVTPSHQFPTTSTLPMERRQALLARAVDDDFVILEDDYEFETNYLSAPTPALKSLDRNDRVIYIGSLSKTLFPGLRLGFMVGPKDMIREARALRRLMLRHPPTNNQRTAALFLSLGHHDALIHRLNRAYKERWQRMGEALGRHLPDAARPPSFGGTSFWVRGPDGLDSDVLTARAREEGVLIEPGRLMFAGDEPPRNFFRLGFSSIDVERIEPGIEIIAGLIKELSR